MIVLWTMILLLTPFTPSTGEIRELCLNSGGRKLEVLNSTLTDFKTGITHKTLTIHCLQPVETGPPKVGA